MRSLSKLLALLLLLFVSAPYRAQAQAKDEYNGIGTPATPEEIAPRDISIGISGKELPPGSGTAVDGAKIYTAKCAVCHGDNAEGKIGPRLFGGIGTLKDPKPVKTVGSYLPFATTLYDYINRAMPKGNGLTLKPVEVYSLTAFVLFKNGIIKETDVMDAKSLPKIVMPNRHGFIPDKTEDIADMSKRDCKIGNCP